MSMSCPPSWLIGCCGKNYPESGCQETQPESSRSSCRPRKGDIMIKDGLVIIFKVSFCSDKMDVIYIESVYVILEDTLI